MYDDVTHGQSADQLVLPKCCRDAPPLPPDVYMLSATVAKVHCEHGKGVQNKLEMVLRNEFSK